MSEQLKLLLAHPPTDQIRYILQSLESGKYELATVMKRNREIINDADNKSR